MEKAHPSVFNVLLQLMDDGRLTDAKGNTVNFRNCVIVFTSNIGSSIILQELGRQGEDTGGGDLEGKIMEEMKAHFRPEFLNRIDEFITFNSLNQDMLEKIVALELNKVKSRLNEKKLKFEITEAAMNWLAKKGFDVIFGVRPLKRTIQREVETPVAQFILAGLPVGPNHQHHDTIYVDVPNVDDLLKQQSSKIEHLVITSGIEKSAPVLSTAVTE